MGNTTLALPYKNKPPAHDHNNKTLTFVDTTANVNLGYFRNEHNIPWIFYMRKSWLINSLFKGEPYRTKNLTILCSISWLSAYFVFWKKKMMCASNEQLSTTSKSKPL